MKTAKKIVASWIVTCPGCGESLDNPLDGSIAWDDSTIYPGETVRCHLCGTESKIPKRLRADN